MLAILLCVLHFAGGSNTIGSTRQALKEFALRTGPRGGVGRSSGDVIIRTSFYKALGDIERSMRVAEDTFTPTRAQRSTRSLMALRRCVVSSAMKGRYKIGREIFSLARYLEDEASRSRSRRRHKRAANTLIDFIRDKLGDQTFNEFFSIESGTTLTFVLDTTGSMYEDLHQVQGIVRELSTPSEDEESEGSGFFTFVLTPFKDPDYGPVEEFDEKGEFLSALETMTVGGGGDCDEMVMNGILEGLLDTQPYSPVFVFTDAGSKDKEEMENVLTFAETLLSPLFFFLTPSPECPTNATIYEKLAQDSSGQVLRLSKEEIGEMKNLVKSHGIGRSSITDGTESGGGGSKRDKRNTGETHTINFDCDSTISRLLVSINFENPTGSCYLLGPDRELVYPSFVSALTNMRLYEIPNPPHGAWTIRAITDIGDKFTYKVNSVSPTNIDLDYYFLEQYRGREVIAQHTVPGNKMKIRLSVLGDETLVNLDRSEVYLADMSGNVISTVQTLTQRPSFPHQYDGIFIVPSETFKVVLLGATEDGYPFTRTSQNTVTPSYGKLEAFTSVVMKRLVAPGADGSFYFKFEHFSDTTLDFLVTFTNPSNVIRTQSPFMLTNIRKNRSKLVRLAYRIPRNTSEGTELRLSVIVRGGEVKARYVHTFLVTRFAAHILIN